MTGAVSGLITGTAAQSLIGDESVAGEVATALVGVEPSARAQVRTNAKVNLDDPQMGDAAPGEGMRGRSRTIPRCRRRTRRI